MHLFNLPLTLIEFVWAGVKLTQFDLCFIALVYCLFYLNVLDAWAFISISYLRQELIGA